MLRQSFIRFIEDPIVDFDFEQFQQGVGQINELSTNNEVGYLFETVMTYFSDTCTYSNTRDQFKKYKLALMLYKSLIFVHLPRGLIYSMVRYMLTIQLTLGLLNSQTLAPEEKFKLYREDNDPSAKELFLMLKDAINGTDH